MRDDFAVFILTHGRPDKVKTYNTLKKQGYTGKLFFILDDEDETIDEYIKNFGKERIIVFNKSLAARTVDTPDLSEDRRTIVYARNICFDVAAMLGLRYFLQLDDDYKCFRYRYEKDGRLLTGKINDLNRLFFCMIDFLNETGALTVAFAQSGDFLGGVNNGFWKSKVKRKAMNSFFCDTKKPFQFFGRINEDVNFYTVKGNQGKLILSIADVSVEQQPTQLTNGGMTEVYTEKGTFLKSFYSVVYSPQCVKVADMGEKHRRIHHRVSWNNCTPMILSDEYKI